VVLLASWPLLVLALLLVILASAVPAWFLLGYSGPEVVEAALRNSGAFLSDSSWIWGSAAVLLLIWPVTARPWTRWWAGRAADRSSMPGHVHASAALLVMMVLLAPLLPTS
jgi:hypothetical protein